LESYQLNAKPKRRRQMKAKKINKVEQVRRMLEANPKIKPEEVMAKLGSAKSYTYVLMTKARNLHKRLAKAPMQASGAIGKAREEAWAKGINLANDIKEKETNKARLLYRLTGAQAEFAKKNGIPLEDYEADTVNHPAHYKVGGIETIDFIEAKKLGYNLGNVVKYITRADHKGNKLEDLRKAQWYLTREIEAAK
jgi:hypothetical protein